VTEFDNMKHSCRAALQLRKHRLLVKKQAERAAQAQAAAEEEAPPRPSKAARTSKAQTTAQARKAAAQAAAAAQAQLQEEESDAEEMEEGDEEEQEEGEGNEDEEKYVDADYRPSAPVAGPMFPGWMSMTGAAPPMGNKLGMTQPHRPKPIDAVALHGGRASASASPVGGMSASTIGLGLAGSRAASPWAPPAPWLQPPVMWGMGAPSGLLSRGGSSNIGDHTSTLASTVSG
jgi:hypothetical protein